MQPSKPEKTTKTTATYYPKLSRQDSIIGQRKDSVITASTITTTHPDELPATTPTPSKRGKEITPAAALAQVGKSGGYESESGDEFAPLDTSQSVALKPYSHQVGGHSALFKFSRHAVCKPLVEKENMFYQEVEINRPECNPPPPLLPLAFSPFGGLQGRWLMVVLPFMPRYIGTLNVTHRDFITPTPQSGGCDSSAPPTPLTMSPKVRSPAFPPQGTITPTRTATPLPEVQIDKNRHVPPTPPDTPL